MIVEDEPIVRDGMRSILSRHGLLFEPIPFDTMREAVAHLDQAKARNERIDLLIADLILKGDPEGIPASRGSGVEVIRHYRRCFGEKSPVIVLSQFQALSRDERQEIPGNRWLDKDEILPRGGSIFLRNACALLERASW